MVILATMGEATCAHCIGDRFAVICARDEITGARRRELSQGPANDVSPYPDLIKLDVTTADSSGLVIAFDGRARGLGQ